MSSTPDIHDLVGAYALDAVDADEQADFEEHLAECDACRTDVEQLRWAASSLGERGPVTPPPELWERVRAAAVSTPQVPAERVPARHGFSRRRLLTLTAAAAAMVVVGGGVTAVVTRQGEEGSVTAAQVFAASDARVRTVTTPAGAVRLGRSQHLGRVAVDVSGLRGAGAAHTYQLWRVPQSGSPDSLAVLNGSRYAVARLGAGTLALTVEPAGGSARPTTQPLFAVPMGTI